MVFFYMTKQAQAMRTNSMSNKLKLPFQNSRMKHSIPHEIVYG